VDEVFAPDGLQASTYRSIEELEGLEYDNGQTEKDYLNELIEALKDAGVEIDENGVSFPSGFPEGGKRPAWPDIDEALEKLRNAILDWKNKAREQGGQDFLEGKEKFEIDVFIEIDGVLVRIRLVISDGSVANVGDSDRHPDQNSDNEDAPRIVIAVGKCGRDHNGGDATSGANAPAVRIRKRGTLGVSVGGNGGNGQYDPTVPSNPNAAKGADGGNASVNVRRERDSTNRPSTGIAIGGNGGDSNGEGGSGGDADAASRDRGADASVAARAGDSGTGRNPPRRSQTKAGEFRVENPDSGGSRTRAGAKGGESNGVAGKITGGIGVAQPRQPAESDLGRLDQSGVTTPGGED